MSVSITTRCVGQRNDLAGFFAFLDKVKESHYHHVHLAFGELTGLLTKDFDKEGFSQRFCAYGFSVDTAHAPMIFPFVFNGGEIDYGETAMMTALKTAAACGVTDFVMHLGTVIDGEGFYLAEPSAEKNMTYLRPYLAEAVKLGIRIDVENGTNQPQGEDHPMQHDFAKTGEISLLDVSPGIEELMVITETLNREFGEEACGICFDCGHANLAHLDIPAKIRTIGSSLKVVHIHDNDGSDDQHLLPFKGNIDWSAVTDALKDIGFAGELALELYFENGELEKDPVSYLNHTFHILEKLSY